MIEKIQINSSIKMEIVGRSIKNGRDSHFSFLGFNRTNEKDLLKVGGGRTNDRFYNLSILYPED